MKQIPTLIGISGAFKGEICLLEQFRPYVVGRSRDADISVRRTDIFRRQTDAEREKDAAAKTISGRHFQIVFFNLNSIEIKNFSPNGTRVDGNPVDGSLVISDIASKTHEISCGQDARFRLELRDVEDRSKTPTPE